MFFVLGKETWTEILTYKGAWDPYEAVAYCVWTALATLEGLRIIIVAYPLWTKGRCGARPRKPSQRRSCG